jgi:hypothetical protein
VRLSRWYIDRLTAVSTRSPAVRLRFLEVLHMLRPPAALFRPDVALRVLLSRP